ncbi:deoxyribonuclease IV [Lacrimispora sp. NSJ-141]|uniref:Probable endonuclease 4 n=1 Tax=Lientehia hominis TaxID=2897778 RepID=A0AAP2RK59_9FIRM|nr:deoxyribonuclease IV [Lientehia hominis]MCD2493411.1 deoxyribonuclease IV [Lientehia hominis]
MIFAGSHISSAKGYAAMGKQIEKLGGDTFAFFTRNPRGGKAKDIKQEDVKEFLEISAVLKFGPLVAHAPYTLNACAAKENLRDFARDVMKDDLKRLEYTPGNYYNFHPGCHVGQGTEKGIEQIAEILNEIITPDQHTIVLLETMAGKGSEVGGRFEELRGILDRVALSEKVGVCLDTCHVWDAGYDIVNDLDGVLGEFDRVIGLERLKALHTNDSQNPRGSHKDRHATLGNGTIGRDAFVRLVNHPAVQGLPCIMETPNDEAGWTEEIAFMKHACRQ